MPGSNVADYRLRLFLSVDLANSTVFKFREGNRPAASEISSGHTSTRPRWLVVTTKFYSDFTAVLISRFNALRAAMEIKCDFEPKIWKTIGDEIVFAMTVKTSDEIALCVTAFIESLTRYRQTLQSTAPQLDVQGTGWLAAFPTPNSTISLARLSGEGQMIFDPEDESQSDNNPIGFDFLGMSIDAGFRIARFSKPALMPITLELALVLTERSIQRKFASSFVYDGRAVLKGVLDGREYPIIYIDTETIESRMLVAARESAMTGRHTPGPQAIHDFIAAFMNDECIERPYFHEDPKFPGPPESYRRFLEIQNSAFNEIAREDQSRYESQISNDPEGGDLELPENVAKRLQRAVSPISNDEPNISRR